MRTEFLCISVLRVAAGLKRKLVGCKSVLNTNPPLPSHEQILVLFVRLFYLCLFGFVGFLFLLVSGNGCGLWLWHSLDFSLTLFYSTDCSKAVVPVLVLLFVALWFIIRGDLFYILPCVILFLCFSVLLALQLPRLGKRELILVLFVHLFNSCCLDLSVSSSSWCLGRAAVCDCGTPWTFLLPFLLFYEGICFMSYLVLFCSCGFQSFSIAITSLGEERANLSAFCTFVRFLRVWFCRFCLHFGVWERLRFVIVALPGLFLYLFSCKSNPKTMLPVVIYKWWILDKQNNTKDKQ